MQMNIVMTTIPDCARPMGVCQNSLGHLYIAEFDVGRVRQFDRNLNCIASFSSEFFFGPHGMTTDSKNNLYVADYMQHRIQKFSVDGKFIGTFLSKQTAKSPWQLYGPCALCFDKDENLIVVNFLSNCLEKYSLDGDFLGWLGASSEHEVNDGWHTEGRPVHTRMIGGFDRPSSVCFDGKNNMYVTDCWNHRVQKFDFQGHAMGWLGKGREEITPCAGFRNTGEAELSGYPGGFHCPMAIDCVGDELFIVDANRHVQKFSTDGAFLGWLGRHAKYKTFGWQNEWMTFGNEASEAIFNNAADLKAYGNEILVADTDHNRVLTFKFFR